MPGKTHLYFSTDGGEYEVAHMLDAKLIPIPVHRFRKTDRLRGIHLVCGGL